MSNKAADPLPGLNGARVALLEARMTSIMVGLVEMYGGQPYAVPALRETPVASDRVERLIHGIARGRFSIVVFQTGVAAQLLFDEAEKRGMLADVRDRLARCTTVCRGPKPAAGLGSQRRQGNRGGRRSVYDPRTRTDARVTRR